MLSLKLEGTAQFCRMAEEKFDKKLQDTKQQLADLQVEKTLNLSQPAKPEKPAPPRIGSISSIFFSTKGLLFSLFSAYLSGAILSSVFLAVFVQRSLIGVALLFMFIMWVIIKYLHAKRIANEELQAAQSYYEQHTIRQYDRAMNEYKALIMKQDNQRRVYEELLRTNELIKKNIPLQVECLEKQKREVITTRIEIEKKLRHLYDEDIICAKYRNFVALSYIRSYLLYNNESQSKGLTGAYDQYESDTSKGLICNQLDMLLKIAEESPDIDDIDNTNMVLVSLHAIHGKIVQLQRNIRLDYIAVSEAAATMGHLLKYEKNFSESTAQVLTYHINRIAEKTPCNTAIVFFRQDTDVALQRADRYYASNR